MDFCGIKSISQKNFLDYCKLVYVLNEPHGTEDVQEILKHVGYLKRIFKDALDGRSLKARLALNHIIVLYNVFGAEHTVRILFYKLGKAYYPILKAIFSFMNIMPDAVDGFGEEVLSIKICVDGNVLKQLYSMR